MEPLDSLNRWTERMRDRARMGTFFRFLAKRFLDDRLFQAAAALAYTTLFALVPLAMVVFGVLSAFPVFQEWSAQLRDYIFANFLPGAAVSLKAKLDGFLANTGKLTAVAGGGDTVSALNHAGVADDMTFVSTAGGAFLEWMEGKELPGVAVLTKG